MHNGVKVLDVHSHVAMPAFATGFLAQMMGLNSPSPNPLKETLATGTYGGRLIYADESTEGLSGRDLELDVFAREVDYHVGYIDDRNIDLQVIGPRPFITAGWVEPHIIGPWSEYVNTLIGLQCTQYPDRFVGAAQLPYISTAPSVEHVIPELDRCVNELGFVAAYLAPDPSGHRLTPGLQEDYWNPLYKRAVELQIPLIVHGTTSFDPRFRGVPHNYQMGFVIEQFIAHQTLRWSNVFDRFSDLKIIICHCGSVLDRFLPYDEVHIPQKDLRNNLFYDTCSYNEIMLEAAIKQRGADQMCFGSEAPGSGSLRRRDGLAKTADDLVPVIDSFSFLSAEDKTNIFNGNVLRAFPLLKSKASSTS